MNFTKITKDGDKKAQTKLAEDQKRLDVFVETIQKLEQSSGCEIVAVMQYRDNGAYPMLKAQLRRTTSPETTNDQANQGQAQAT